MGALIHIENMKKIYNPGENEVRALDGIDLDIEKGDLVAIVGHSAVWIHRLPASMFWTGRMWRV